MLAPGTLLGAVTFWALSSPERMAALPVYLRSSLNCGFVITVICTGVMALCSGGKDGHARADEVASIRSAAAGMADRERRIYRVTLAVLAVVWLAVVRALSPWGWAGAP